MPMKYRADIFTVDHEHIRRTFETEAEALLFIEGAQESGARAGFLLKYSRTTCAGMDIYDVAREIFNNR